MIKITVNLLFVTEKMLSRYSYNYKRNNAVDQSWLSKKVNHGQR